MHHDNERALSAEEIDEELEKGVDCECLIHVANRIDKLGGGKGDKGDPRRYGVNRDHEENADHIALKERLPVVLPVQE